ncbi:MAG: TonB-dependent receptor [Parafilimonas sp.]|nr:TonB-dependent receptor [Parafilimonas sp.]
MHAKFYLFVALFFISTYTFSQGIISGKITDATNNQVLVGATVAVKNSKAKTLTDVDGVYRIANLPAGQYTLEVTYIGFTPKDISDVNVAGNTVSLNISLDPQQNTVQAVVVTTTSARRESLNSILVTRRNAAVVSDAISADIIRKSPDKSIGDVLKRVSGVTVQDNKFIVVRGMSDRYNEAMLNGALLPSTEPDRKSFAFDIFPSDIVDNITIVKSALPEYPATFTGGLTIVNLKDVPEKSFFSLEAGTGINTITTGNSYYHDVQTGNEIFGLDNGGRSLPSGFPDQPTYNNLSDKKQIDHAKKFPNDWAIDKYASAPLNSSFQLAGGFNAIAKSGYPKFGGIFGASYSSSYKYSSGVVKDYGEIHPVPADSISGIQYPYYNFNDSTYTHSVLSSALANFALKLNPNNKFFFNNLLAINSSNQTVVRHGSAIQVIGGDFDSAYFGYAHYYQSNIIYNSQLGGEHYLSKLKLRIHWLGYYTEFHRNEPDYRQLIYYKNSPEDPYTAYIASPTLFATTTGGLRLYFDTRDIAKGANVDFNKSFRLFDQNQAFKFGFFYYYDTRNRDGRFLRNDMPDYNSSLLTLPPGEIFNKHNFNPNNGFVTTDFAKPAWIKYSGSIQNTAAYAMFDNKFTDKFRLAWGIRYEYYRNKVLSYDPNNSQPIYIDSTYKDFLPSANLVYSILPKANIRLSYSKTVARPLYRELASTFFYDFFNNITYHGGPLTETKIDNYELRWEQYLQGTQYYSVSAYYKKFKNPIEEKVDIPGADSKTVTWQNAPSAELWGIEGELRKSFDFIMPALKDLYFYVNASYIHSVAFVAGNGSDTSNRPLQGQSPYVINTSLQYSNDRSGLNISLLYNAIGSRIVFVAGPNNTYAVWEQVHPNMDFKISKTVMKNGLVELSLADILHKSDILYYNFDNNKQYNAVYPDVLVQSRSYGMRITLSIRYRF